MIVRLAFTRSKDPTILLPGGREWEEDVAPGELFKKQKGFIQLYGAQSIFSPSKFLSLTLWESMEDLMAAFKTEEWQGVLNKFLPLIHTDSYNIEVYDVRKDVSKQA